MTGFLLAEGFAIRWWEILIHLFNLVILIMFLKILVYKPVLKIIEQRRRQIHEIEDENFRLEETVEELEHEKEELEHEVEELEHEKEELEHAVEELEHAAGEIPENDD